ncbi:glycoside hydrolase 43 family protein [Alkalihalobacillus trypoxylicola]|uniref:Glycoside hydrolase n=1 Tax=Alkalihalobacillus trypoxylicola TaxID=519424 RepID=A0A162CWV6_9BACI|nr:glycoside hydrolase 43 family protein [Alkalihalobacillus trypoxylicola]KYG26966.1 glycoside hydrolase [Alkalihalobacillus trypoxylicola]
MSQILIQNPIIWADVPDPCIIRVHDTYYMTSTSMHSMPGCPIMKSINLRDWEICSYVFNTFETNEHHELLNGKDIYGRGAWATSLRYHEGTYYVCFSSNDTQQFYIYQTEDIEGGSWERHVLQGLHHDPSLLFDEDRTYVIYGNGKIMIAELTKDASSHKEDGINEVLFETETDGIGLRCEGCHAYKLNGFYYLFFIEWPQFGNKRRRQVCYRSKNLFGPYESKIILDDDLGYLNQGVAQGGIVDTLEGEWFSLLFQDHGAVGRVPILLPLTWSNNWPVLDRSGKAPLSFLASFPDSENKPIVVADDFNYLENKLALQWQWNHNPDPRLWSLTEKPGCLRLRTGYLSPSVEFAKNTLTQRTEGPACKVTTSLHFKNMKVGDRAGLVALQHYYATVAITKESEGFTIVMGKRGENGYEDEVESLPFDKELIYLRMDFHFVNNQDTVKCYYSEDEINWISIGETHQLRYTLDHFMGCRIGLFNYASKDIGGFVDFNYFRYEKL